MASTGIHPRERANKSDISTFGEAAGAVDQAEAVAWDRIGGPSRDDIAAIRRAERALFRFRPVTDLDWQWLARRLASAIENGWGRDSAMPLAALAM